MRSIVTLGLALIGLVVFLYFPAIFIWDDFKIQNWKEEATDFIASLPLFEMWLLVFGLFLFSFFAPFALAVRFRHTTQRKRSTPSGFGYLIWIVARFLKVALIVTGAVAVLAGPWLVYAWHNPPSSVPLVSMELIGYTNFTIAPIDPSEFCYPGRGKWLEARMRLTNEGSATISYGAWGDEPYGWANAQTDQEPTNGYLAPPFTGGIAVLHPGSTATFSVILPTNTLKWQCGLDVETSSLRNRAIWRVINSKVYKKVPDLFFYPVLFLPDASGPGSEIKSQMIEVTNGIGSELAPPQSSTSTDH